MALVETRSLHRGWPLFEGPRQFELGQTFNIAGWDLAEFAVRHALGRNRAGWWQCVLPNNELTWTTGVYEIFGLPRHARITRPEAVGLYCEDSRAAMERLRNDSIAHRNGFVLDAQIKPASGEPLRWMRLIGVPVCEDGKVVQLHGLKLRL